MVDKMNYFDTVYFQLITMTTCGYGDIYPRNLAGRLITTCLISYYTYLFAYYVSVIVLSIVNNKNSVPKLRKIKNHTIIIGNLLSSSTLTEHFLNGIFAKNFEHKKKYKKSRLIFIHKSNDEKQVSSYINLTFLRTFKQIKNIKILNYELSDLDWINDANIVQARYLICFYYYDRKTILHRNIQMQKDIVNIISYMRNYQPHIKVYCTIQSSYIEKQLVHFQKEDSQDQFYKSRRNNVKMETQMVSYSTLRQNIFALALTNDGCISLFCKLIMNNQQIYKNFWCKVNQMNLEDGFKTMLQREIDSYHQFVFISRLSPVFKGYSLKQLNCVFMKIARNKFKHPILCFGVKKQSLNKKSNQIEFKDLINPQNYKYQLEDYLYILANNRPTIDLIRNITEDQIRYYLVSSKYLTSYKEKSEVDLKISEIFDYKNQEVISNLRSITRKKTHFIHLVDLQEYLQMKLKKKLLKDSQNGGKQWEDDDQLTSEKCVLRDLKKQEGHFIILGLSMDIMKKYINQFNLVTQKSLVFVVEEQFTPQLEQELMKQSDNYNYNYDNIYIIRGNCMDLKHLKKLRVDKCQKVVLMNNFTQHQENQLEDQHLIQIFLNIKHHFPQTNVIFELLNPNSLKLLDHKPVQKDIPLSFWPHSLQGNVYMTNKILCSMNNNNYYNLGGILLKLINIQQSYQSKYLDGKKVRENSLFNNLKIDSYLQSYFETYGEIVNYMNQLPDGVIVIGLRKKLVSSDQLNIDEQFIDLFDYTGNQVLLNPPLETPLQQDDSLFIIGILNLHQLENVYQRSSKTLNNLSSFQKLEVVEENERIEHSMSILKSNYQKKKQILQVLECQNKSFTQNIERNS